jgi:hypothetical protein
MDWNIFRQAYIVTPTGNVIRKATSKLRKPRLTQYGYFDVFLSYKGITANFLIHRLVAFEHLPNPKGLPFINHKNGIKTDNRVENLEWCTSSHNQLHANRVLNRYNRISRRLKCKLSEKQVLEIRSSLLKGVTLSKIYGVATTTICDIRKGRRWRHI